MENKSKGTLIKISIISGIIAIITLVFFATYYFSINKSFNGYESNIDTIVNSINKVNSDIEKLNTNDKFDPKTISESLWGKTKLLNDIKNKLNNITPPAKYKDSYNYLMKGLNQNISTYNYLINLLKAPTNSNYQKNIDNIKYSYRECEKYYSSFTMKNITLNRPKSVENLINTSINYTYEEFKKYRDKEISQNQITDFSEKIDTVYTNFSKIKKDYFNLVPEARVNKINYDDLLGKIDVDLSEIKKISKDLYAISIPERQAGIYNSLKTLLNDYQDYLENFKYTVSIEQIKIKNDNVDMESLNSLYNTSNAKLANVNIDIENFTNLYKELKKSLY
ncbi:hypothetical protein [Clostridium sp. KNHs214]|uniref:hypothetical protein n=1 Tax=Clostridium sp. KNHs214 TaxID=1540257 RepID=UPI000558B8B6|nr:hypothetical protein [Clostridium sp. KNHs214]